MTRYVIVGGGIVGLATAHALAKADPGAQLTLLEKESALASHQTGRNSGVIHSGIYYQPGSAKAVMCRAGAESMKAFAEQHGIPVVRTGKLIVATDEAELPGLNKLYERGQANQIEVERLGPEQAREYEPHVAALAALRVSATAITDYTAVCRALASELAVAGADVRLGVEVRGLHGVDGQGTTVETSEASFVADVVINCAGLQADRVAAKDEHAGVAPDSQIVPFRGEYYELRPAARHLVKGLIYPVPDPDFPFLGVHLTKMVDGSVHAGPNAVLALAREGYNWHTVRPADVAAVLRFGGFWRLARKNFGPGMIEVARSMSKKRFAASLARLVPAITADDLVPSKAGVRAQALR
ncbi:MAG: L-2-hydroxyglutarate oxidase, partial [Jatrophihabitantaceae bacterium]